MPHNHLKDFTVKKKHSASANWHSSKENNRKQGGFSLNDNELEAKLDIKGLFLFTFKSNQGWCI